jgi:membrane carboxypeptidase/penicillin-binding protein PbpC
MGRSAHLRRTRRRAFSLRLALGGDGVEASVALVAMAATIGAVVKLAENFIKAPEHEYQQLRASAMRCKVCYGP